MTGVGGGQTKHKGGTVGDRMCRSFSQTYLTFFTDLFLPEGKNSKVRKQSKFELVCVGMERIV
jgi:hypothetical protein